MATESVIQWSPGEAGRGVEEAYLLLPELPERAELKLVTNGTRFSVFDDTSGFSIPNCCGAGGRAEACQAAAEIIREKAAELQRLVAEYEQLAAEVEHLPAEGDQP